MSLKRSSVVNDFLEELNGENKRLFKELLFANKCLNSLIEFKRFVDSISHNFINHLELKIWIKFVELSENVDQVLSPDFETNNTNEWQLSEEIDENGVNLNVESEDNLLQSFENNGITLEITDESVDPSLKSFGNHFYRQTKEVIEDSEETNVDSNEFKKNFNENQFKEYQELNENIETVFKCQLNGTSNAMKSDSVIETNIELRPKEKTNYREEEVKSSESDYNETSDDTDYEEIASSESDGNRTADDPNYEEETESSEIGYIETSIDKRLATKTSKRNNDFECQSISNQKNRKLSVDCDDWLFICEICDKTFKQKSLLSKHMISHSGYRPFSCSVNGCDKKYKWEKHLKDHLEAHSVERNYECTHEGCHKRFKTNRLRYEHLKCHSEINLHCDWPGCDYTTNQKRNITEHLRVHNQEYNFSCRWFGCDKRFKHRKSMNRHMKIHRADNGRDGQAIGRTSGYVCHWPGCKYRSRNLEDVKTHFKTFHQNN